MFSVACNFYISVRVFLISATLTMKRRYQNEAVREYK